MLLAVAALLLQFPVLFPNKTPASEKVNQPAAVAKAAADSAVSSKSENSASSGKEVLNAETLSPDADASVAFAPRRLVAEPVPPVSSAPVAPVAVPASSAAIGPAPAIVPVYAAVYGPPIRAVSDQRQHREWLALSIA